MKDLNNIIETRIINNNNTRLNLEDFLYLTKKVIGLDNNSSPEQLQYKFDLQDKYKLKYNLSTNELFYNIGLVALYLEKNKL